MDLQQQSEFMAEFTQQTIYVMGVSFILGSLTTIFILLILDMVRRMRAESAELSSEEMDNE